MKKDYHSMADGSNYDSTSGVTPSEALFLVLLFLILVGYIIFRVRKELKKDQKKRRGALGPPPF